jgi:hypothetical protein
MKTAPWQRERMKEQAQRARPQPPRAPLPTERPKLAENWQAERRAEQAARWVRRPTHAPRRPGEV